MKAVEDDLTICPDLVLSVGTKLRIPGARSIAANFCHAARSFGGASFWVSKEEPGSGLKSRCDYVLVGDCEEVLSQSLIDLCLHSASLKRLESVP